MVRLRSVSGVVAVAAVMAVTLGVMPASAAKVKTHLIVELTGAPVTDVSLDVGDPDVTLTTHLDDNCLSAFEHANDKTYGVAVKVDATSVATAAPGTGYSGQDCNSVQSWTIHAVANGDTTVYFDPVVTDNGQGLQNQMAGARVQVHVGTGGIVNPPGFELPAAPAIANAHVPHGSDLAGQCKDAYDGAKNWHGLLIHDVAKWARDNHYNRLKHTFTPNDWNTLVITEVDSLCS